GVLGQNRQGLDSILEFKEYAETTPYIWDSELLPIIKSLYRPSKRQDAAGINKLTIVQASETTAATAALIFSKGTLNIKTTFEGASLNGALSTKTYDTSTLSPTSTEL